MSRLFLYGGFDVIKKLMHRYVNNQRKEIDSALKKIVENKLPLKYVPKNEAEGFIANFSNIIEEEQVTPLEYLVLESLNKPKNIKEISEEVNAPENIVANSVNSLK